MSYAPAIHWNWRKFVKIFNGTIVRLQLIGRRHLVCQKEHKEETKKALHLFYCNPDSMNSGGLESMECHGYLRNVHDLFLQNGGNYT